MVTLWLVVGAVVAPHAFTAPRSPIYFTPRFLQSAKFISPTCDRVALASYTFTGPGVAHVLLATHTSMITRIRGVVARARYTMPSISIAFWFQQIPHCASIFPRGGGVAWAAFSKRKVGVLAFLITIRLVFTATIFHRTICKYMWPFVAAT